MENANTDSGPNRPASSSVGTKEELCDWCNGSGYEGVFAGPHTTRKDGKCPHCGGFGWIETKKLDYDYLNLTPHDIVIRTDRIKMTIKASGIVARLNSTNENCGEIDGIPVITRRNISCSNIPTASLLPIFYIVSSLVRTANPDREDLLSPAGFVYDDSGKILYATELSGN